MEDGLKQFSLLERAAGMEEELHSGISKAGAPCNCHNGNHLPENGSYGYYK
ncbi:hypothetical protein [Peribacillus sp. NPDC096448]|uniref:hypothetical protein n=1 Tax=Peribacillus sp. NPDC096448 TaxID=3364395 RepID=UPI00383020B9